VLLDLHQVQETLEATQRLLDYPQLVVVMVLVTQTLILKLADQVAEQLGQCRIILVVPVLQAKETLVELMINP
jgi:nitrogen regulatory protein PII-like uncharacterized protein